MVKKPKNIDELLATCPVNKTICDNMIRAWSIINRTDYKKILCSISGGADSDVMLDIIWKCDIHSKVDYVWFDTGLEYQATKDHLKYLEGKYGIEIIRKKADKTIVNCDHEAIGNKAVAFVGTSGVQMGWLASQADMLAEDWMFVD